MYADADADDADDVDVGDCTVDVEIGRRQLLAVGLALLLTR